MSGWGGDMINFRRAKGLARTSERSVPLLQSTARTFFRCSLRQLNVLEDAVALI